MSGARLMLGAAICCASCSGPAPAQMVDAAIADADASPPIDAMPPAGMVAIPRTTFTMGCNQTLAADRGRVGACRAGYRPAHVPVG